MEIAGNGYLNVRLDRGAYGVGSADAARERREAKPRQRSSSSTPISIPTRPRTSGICATRSWAIRSSACCAPPGDNVEVQNYIDNTGVQVADVVVGFQHLEKKSPDEVRALIESDALRLPVLGSVRANLAVLRRTSGSARSGVTRLLHAIEAGRRRRGGNGAPGGRRHRRSASRDHVAAEYRLRRAAARERNSASAILGHGVRAVEGAQGDLFRDGGQEQRLLGDARLRVPRGVARRATTTARSSCARTARSPTSARTSPISFGNSGCWARIFTIASGTRIRTATRCGRRPIGRRRRAIAALRRRLARL